MPFLLGNWKYLVLGAPQVDGNQRRNGGISREMYTSTFEKDETVFVQIQAATLPETNIAPENRPLEKEIPNGNHHF